MANEELKARAQKLAGGNVSVVGAWREPSTFVDADGNHHSPLAFDGSVERPGSFLVSNGLFMGRGETLEKAVADLLENLSLHDAAKARVSQ